MPQPRAVVTTLLLPLVAAALLLAPAARADDAPWHALTTPIDPRQQTALEWGDRSYWLQPWRGYLETRPSSVLRDAPGMTLNVPAAQLPATSKLLADHGFARGRIEIGWDQMDYADPTRLRDRRGVVDRIRALHANGLRPLILLNANSTAPGPLQAGQLSLTQTALPGARTVQLDVASARKVVVGRTGFNAGSVAARLLITKLDGTTATLSQPLPTLVGTGSHRSTTLRYLPFAPPRAGGGRNPQFERTLDGWLAYVRAVADAAREATGGDRFDLEIWNELSFGSEFLDPKHYFDPVPRSLTGTGSVTDEILRRTVADLRRPALDLAHVGIGDGFANQSPFPAGSTSPPGLTALSKHPYRGVARFPGDRPTTDLQQRALDADGAPAGSRAADRRWADAFVPRFVGFFPEWYLSGLQTETLVRDLSPITTTISGVRHGRSAAPPGGAPVGVWISETGMETAGVGLDDVARRPVQARAALRSIVAYANKGADTVVLYGAGEHQPWGLVDPAFFRSIGASRPQGDRAAGGATLELVSRLMKRIPRYRAAPRQLELREVADQHDRIQFAGNGTARYPDLHDRDVVAFLPFQSGRDRFSVPVYVMSRDVAQVQQPDRPVDDVRRYEAPEGIFRLRIGGVRGGAASVSLYDPVTDAGVGARIVSRSAGEIVVELALTDTPRLLEIRAPTPTVAAPHRPQVFDWMRRELRRRPR